MSDPDDVSSSPSDGPHGAHALTGSAHQDEHDDDEHGPVEDPRWVLVPLIVGLVIGVVVAVVLGLGSAAEAIV